MVQSKEILLITMRWLIMKQISDYLKLKKPIQYNQTYSKIDGIVAIIFWVLFMGLVYLEGKVFVEYGLLENSNTIPGRSFEDIVYRLPFILISILPILIIIKIRNQSFETIGITKNNILKSVLLGLLFSLFNINRIFHLGQSISSFFWNIIFFFFIIALHEELIFRGYLQSRIISLFKHKWIGIILVGCLFALTHIPFQAWIHEKTPLEFFLDNPPEDLILPHVFFVYLYTRYENLLAPTIVHFFMDFHC